MEPQTISSIVTMVGGQVININDQELINENGNYQKIVCPFNFNDKKLKNEDLNDQQIICPFGFENMVEDYMINYWLLNLCLCTSMFSFEY